MEMAGKEWKQSDLLWYEDYFFILQIKLFSQTSSKKYFIMLLYKLFPALWLPLNRTRMIAIIEFQLLWLLSKTGYL